MNLLIKLFASGLGTGFSPVAPGTAGSALAAVSVYLAFRPLWSLPFALALTCVVFLAGVYATSRAEKFWGHDSGKMVIDEVAGYYLALSLVPATLTNIVAAFFLFRALDILKPSPARQAESLPGGWGVMTDDLVAGAYSALLIWGMDKWM